MLKKTICLVISLSSLLAVPAEAASNRYRARPPVIVSPDLSAPWVMQLGGGVQPVVYSTRRVLSRTVVFQNRQAQRVVVNPAAEIAPQPRGLFGLASRERLPVQQAAFSRPQDPARHPIDPAYLPQMVSYDASQKPGTIIIDTQNRFLYLVTGKGEARRYGVGVGKPGFEWKGSHRITRKQEWPTWNPPSEMRAREAAKGHILPASMQGGPENPLGARALYLGSTLYRIHGTNAPWTIGFAVSSGCIRMRNEDVTDLYERVKVGTKVVVL